MNCLKCGPIASVFGIVRRTKVAVGPHFTQYILALLQLRLLTTFRPGCTDTHSFSCTHRKGVRMIFHLIFDPSGARTFSVQHAIFWGGSSTSLFLNSHFSFFSVFFVHQCHFSRLPVPSVLLSVCAHLEYIYTPIFFMPIVRPCYYY